jgi:tetratricopeptide (TPR) repeat protein
LKMSEKGQALARKSLDILTATLGKTHPDTIAARMRVKRLISHETTSAVTRRTDVARRHLEEMTARMQVQRELEKERKQPTQAILQSGASDAVNLADPLPLEKVAPAGSVNETAAAVSPQLMSISKPPALPAADLSVPVGTAFTEITPTNAFDILEESEVHVETFLWEKYMAAGRRSMQTRNFLEAERMFIVALEKAAQFEKGDIRLLNNKCELAGSYTATGKLYKAVSLYREVLECCEAAHGQTSTELVPYLAALARSYAEQGDPMKARKCYERILSIYDAAGAADYETSPYREALMTLRRELEG